MQSEIADRVRVAKRLGMHPQMSGDVEFSQLREGKHYEVVAYTDWCDLFVPTVIEWAHSGEVDRLTAADESLANARRALGVA